MILRAIAFFVLVSSELCLADTALTSATIVVYNRDVPESVELAKFYAQQRGIARDHLVALSCPKEEEISREEYDQTIRDPLRGVFTDRNWWKIETKGEAERVIANDIHFIALIKGMPLKIHAISEYAGDEPGKAPIENRNEASLDSELAGFAFLTRKISGALQNPYFQSY
ncbi:MAG TPA: TIGR03790 family protein, partial [Chthoniobacterales bacterium]